LSKNIKYPQTERRSSKEYSVFILVEGKKFKLLNFLFVVGSAANSVITTLEFTAFGSGPEAKPRRASASTGLPSSVCVADLC